ncbi:MAG: TolC family protein [Planctomycetaceae bacterium]|nr:TolC family protein [Planctomycetaceae bacterium]
MLCSRLSITCLMLLATWGMCANAAAQTNQPPPAPASDSAESANTGMTLTDFQSLALQNNPTLSAARARIQSASGRQVQAGLFPNPIVGYHATEVGNLDTSGVQGGFVRQEFITAGKLGLDQTIAGQDVKAARFHWYAQERRVLNDIEIRFYEALAAQRRVEMATELARIGDELVAATEKLQQGRLRSENDLLQAEIRAEEAHIELDNSLNEREEANRRLATIVGTPELNVSSLSGTLEADLPDLAWEDCQTLLVSNHPELNVARTRSERARIAIERAKREPIPNVTTFVSMRHNNITGSDVANVQIDVPIPVFDRNQGNIAASESDWIAAYKNIQRVELDLQDRLAIAYRQYANARQQAERYSERIIPRSERSLELVTRAYEKGQVEYLTLLIAQQTYVEVTLSYIDSLQDLRTASAVIQGQLLTGSLTSGSDISN